MLAAAHTELHQTRNRATWVNNVEAIQEKHSGSIASIGRILHTDGTRPGYYMVIGRSHYCYLATVDNPVITDTECNVVGLSFTQGLAMLDDAFW
jgi:hypothetical protein